jgi:hypothetical protein
MKTYGGVKIYANKKELGGGGDNQNILFYRRTDVT